jgi:hypothetical protein
VNREGCGRKCQCLILKYYLAIPLEGLSKSKKNLSLYSLSEKLILNMCISTKRFHIKKSNNFSFNLSLSVKLTITEMAHLRRMSSTGSEAGFQEAVDKPYRGNWKRALLRVSKILVPQF